MIVMMSMVGPALLIPLYVQNALALSALLSGLVIMPGAIINDLMSVFTGSFMINMVQGLLSFPVLLF